MTLLTTHNNKQQLGYTYLATPIGKLLLVGQQEQVHFVGFPTGKMAIEPLPHWQQEDTILKDCRIQLTEYFAGNRKTFDLHLTLQGTEFQCQIWQSLQDIPYGKTCSYKDLAEVIGRPKAVRAVGAANGKNPIPVIIPCHRVVGADGSLTGFGGGLDIKQKLLALEGVQSIR